MILDHQTTTDSTTNVQESTTTTTTVETGQAVSADDGNSAIKPTSIEKEPQALSPPSSPSPPQPPPLNQAQLERFQTQFNRKLEERCDEKQRAFCEQLNTAVEDLFRFFLSELKSAYLANPYLNSAGLNGDPTQDGDSDSVMELPIDEEKEEEMEQQPAETGKNSQSNESETKSTENSSSTIKTSTTTTTKASYQAVPSTSTSAGGVGIILRRTSSVAGATWTSTTSPPAGTSNNNNNSLDRIRITNGKFITDSIIQSNNPLYSINLRRTGSTKW